MEIVTGSTGAVHVTPIDDAVRNGNTGYLNDKVVMTCFRNFEASIITNNQVRVYSGYGMNQGRYFKIDDGEFDNVTIENGSQGYKRADLIVARYNMNTQSGFENITLAVIRGNSGNNYVDPSYSTGNINAGDTSDDMPLYRVRINGLQIEGLDRLFTLLPDGGRIAVLEELLSNALPVNHGGTGKTSIGNGKVLVGNASGGFNELGIDSAPSSESNNLITSKGVANALGHAGYGDMMKSIYDPNEDGIIAIGQGGTGANTVAGARQALGLGNTSGALPVANGGTGSQDGTLNGVKLATNGSQKGYIDSNGNFKSFRQPTGNATAAQVLSGYTFANANSDSLSGSMANYSGSNRRTVTPSGGTGNEQIALSAGYHDSVIVNRTNSYNAGVTAAQGTTWTEDLYAEATGPDSVKYRAIIGLPYKNVVKIKNLSSNTVTIEYTTAQGAKSQTLASQAEMTPPAGAIINAQKGPSYWFAVFGASSAVYYANFSIRITFQTKVLR